MGDKITASGNFSPAQKCLSEKATNALYKIRKHLKLSRLSVKLASKIFHSMVLPIQSCCSEVWGPQSKFDFGSWEKTAIEKVNLRFCKLYLEINRKASNVASKLEMTRFSLQIPTMKRIVNIVYIWTIRMIPQLSNRSISSSKSLKTKCQLVTTVDCDRCYNLLILVTPTILRHSHKTTFSKS